MGQGSSVCRSAGTAGAVLVAGCLLLTSAGCGGSGEKGASPAPAASTGPPPAGRGTGGVRLTKLGDFASPVHVAQAPGGPELYVVEQGGAIRVIGGDGSVRPQPFLDISGQVTNAGEQGLLSVAFPPDYAQSGLFYVYFTDTAGDERLVEYHRSAGDRLQADPRSARLVLRIEDPYPNHNGGLLLFGPDRYLYLGNGDGGSEDDPNRTGQDLSTLFGKMLRIDPRPSGGRPYSTPASNRFRAGARPEIFAYGLRNPWRYSFDRKTGRLWIGDVGQSRIEEIDRAPGARSGVNYGWSAYEGRDRFNEDQVAPNAAPPYFQYTHARGCSVTGGYVVRDRRLRSLYGRYLYGDFCAGVLRSFAVTRDGPRDEGPVGVRQVPALDSFGEDLAGRIYVVSQEGPVYRLDPR